MKLIVVKYVGSFILQEISSALHQAASVSLLTWGEASRKLPRGKFLFSTRKKKHLRRRDNGDQDTNDSSEGKGEISNLSTESDQKTRKSFLQEGRRKRVEAIQRLLRKLRGGGYRGDRRYRSRGRGEEEQARGRRGEEEEAEDARSSLSPRKISSPSSSSFSSFVLRERKELLAQILELLIPSKFSDSLQPVYRGMHFLAELQFNKSVYLSFSQSKKQLQPLSSGRAVYIHPQ